MTINSLPPFGSISLRPLQASHEPTATLRAPTEIPTPLPTVKTAPSLWLKLKRFPQTDFLSMFPVSSRILTITSQLVRQLNFDIAKEDSDRRKILSGFQPAIALLYFISLQMKSSVCRGTQLRRWWGGTCVDVAISYIKVVTGDLEGLHVELRYRPV